MLWSLICCPCLFPDKVNVSYSLYILLVILIYWVLVLQQSLEKTLRLKFRKTNVYVYNSISYYKTATEWKCSFLYLKYLKKHVIITLINLLRPKQPRLKDSFWRSSCSFWDFTPFIPLLLSWELLVYLVASPLHLYFMFLYWFHKICSKSAGFFIP